MEDTFESMDDEEEMEEMAEAEVDRILFEITAGKRLLLLTGCLRVGETNLSLSEKNLQIYVKYSQFL